MGGKTRVVYTGGTLDGQATDWNGDPLPDRIVFPGTLLMTTVADTYFHPDAPRPRSPDIAYHNTGRTDAHGRVVFEYRG